jgi:AcrR family transcriptional regulator
MATSTTATSRLPKGKAPHRRDEAAQRAVINAADDLLVEGGFNALTIEGIAARAGVAKQTIYRWWSSKVEILLDALIWDAAVPLKVPEKGAAPAAVRRYLRQLARFLSQEDAGRVLLALIGAAQHDPEVAAAFNERFLAPQRTAERGLLRRGVAAGEFPADLDIDAALDALTGPIYFRALTGSKIPAAFIDGLMAAALGERRAV